MVSLQLCLAASLALTLSVVSTFPSGAPPDACADLNPVFHGPSTATDESPYTLTFSGSSYQAGQVITVTLSGADFEGFLIVGRKASDPTGENVGYFQSSDSTDFKLLCEEGKNGNGVTHTSNSTKSAVEFGYQAPNPSVGDIVFRYTVVRGESGAPDYFMDLQSSTLTSV